MDAIDLETVGLRSILSVNHHWFKNIMRKVELLDYLIELRLLN